MRMLHLSIKSGQREAMAGGRGGSRERSTHSMPSAPPRVATALAPPPSTAPSTTGPGSVTATQEGKAPHHRWSGSPSPSSVFPSSACPFLHLTSCGSVSCWDPSWDRAGPFSRLPALLPVSTGMRPTAASPSSETRQAKSASPWPSALFLSPCCCGNDETGVSKGCDWVPWHLPSSGRG